MLCHTHCTTRCHMRAAVLMLATRRLSLDDAACRHCESTRIRPRCPCPIVCAIVPPSYCLYRPVPSLSAASVVCVGSVCSRRSPSHTPLRLHANHHCTDRIRVDASLALSPANVRGILVSDMRPAFNWGVRVGVVAPTAAAQRAALVDLYMATSGSTWSINTGWKDHTTASDPCDNGWYGVICSGSVGSANRGA